MQHGSVVEFGELLGGRLVAVIGSPLVGVYLHGSAALGGFRPGASDIDVLVVVDDHLSVGARRDVIREVQSVHAVGPGRGIEASVILSEVAQAGGRRLDFELHVTTDPKDSKLIDGASHPGDPDLILHIAVCRQSGIPLFGPNPETVFAEVGPRRIIHKMVDELTWSLEHASEAYTVLNTCRALFYLDKRVLCSKLEGGMWARHHLRSPDLIDRSMAAQQGHSDDRPPSTECRHLVATAVSALTSELGRIPHD